ncbi:MAG: hypothetical protein H6825_06385 [Planctomycetes bacterium]|nr:hypothetical protein [Planctomycetota bacterium]
MMRTLIAACLLLAVGCGLVPPAPIDFRIYPLDDVPPSEARELVRGVVHDVFTARFGGGFGMSVDGELGNLVAGPVEEGQKRLTLYVTFTPRGAGTDLEMLALVESMGRADTGMVGWGDPKMDVYFEEKVYQAVLQAQLDGRTGAPR